MAKKPVHRIYGGVVDQKVSILLPSIWLSSQQNIVLMPPKNRHASLAPKPLKAPKGSKIPRASKPSKAPSLGVLFAIVSSDTVYAR